MSSANPSPAGHSFPPIEPLRIGVWLVTPASGEIASDGEVTHLEPKVMEVLVYLASRPGEVISRQDLERDVWRGALVGYDAVTGTIIKLRKALGDSTKQPRYIATVPKRGYRLIAPVSSAGEDNPAVATTAFGSPSDVARRRFDSRRTLTAVSLFVVAVAAATAIFLYLNGTQPPVAPRERPPSIVVLPFADLGDDPQHDGFADGITEDVVTDLSRLSDLMVLATNTSFSFKGKEVTAQQVGAELDVDFVLQGSIRRRNQFMRINARLVDADSGFQVWAERYDRPAAEIFNVQDEVTAQIVKSLAVNLTQQEAARLSRRSTNNLDAYDRFLEGQRLGRVFTKESNRLAEAAYHQAIELDPSYGRAYGALAYTLAANYRRGWTDTPQLTKDRALELAKTAVALDGSIPQTYWALGYVRLMRRELAEAEATVTQALTIAPNYADGYGLLALIKNAQGDADTALALVEKGMRLNPHYTWDYPYNRGRAYYTLGRIDDAIASLEEARSRNGNAVPVRIHLAASYARAGRLDDAEWEVDEVMALSPSDTISQLRNAHPTDDPQLMGALIEDLRKAGMPE